MGEGGAPVSSTFELREIGLHVEPAPPALTYACPDADLGALVARLVTDLAEGTGLDVVLAWQGAEAYLAVDGERRASAWSGGADRREAAVYIAGVFQDVLVQSLGGVALPACPGHPHPAVPRTTPDGVGWLCPDTGAVLRAYRLS